MPAVVFAALLAVLSSSTGPTGSLPSVADRTDVGAPSGDTRARSRACSARWPTSPARAEGYAALGDAYLQRARETGDPSLYARAERVLRRGAAPRPAQRHGHDRRGHAGSRRHDFAEGLRLGERALALAPGTVRPYAVIVDAQVELGRYSDAARSLQRMVDLKPNLASYSRVSYFRELTGDLAEPSRRWRWRSRPAAEPPRTWPTSRRCWATSS